MMAMSGTVSAADLFNATMAAFHQQFGVAALAERKNPEKKEPTKTPADPSTEQAGQKDEVALQPEQATAEKAATKPGTTAAPDYEPDKWNDAGKVADQQSVQLNSNCYAYALDQKGPIQGQPGVQPGDNGNPPKPLYLRSQITVEGIRERAIADGLSTTPVNGGYPVYLVVAPGRDYHWYRLDSNGTWSHKPGSTPVTNKDASGKVITDPAKADHDYRVRGPNYSQPGGYLWVPPNIHLRRP